MIFLNPAVLFGLLAASVPILIHLFNLRKLKKIEFSTLAFLKELQKNKIRKIKLKQWLLLALRVLIVLFLVTAFARPTLEGFAIGGTTSAAKSTVVFILDNSFSMSVIDGQGSYFNQAKSGIQKILNQLQEGDEAVLILTSETADEEIKPTNDLKEFNKSINLAEISHSSGYLHSAIVKAGEILNESRNFNKEIYLFSDFQNGSIGKQEEFSNLEQLLNNNIRLYAFQYSGKEVYNVGIDDIKLNTQIFEKDKPVNFSVTVTNYSGRSGENIVVSLFINGERSAQQSISLEPGKSEIITMEAAAKQTGFINVFAEIEDDDIVQDNRRYTNLYIPVETPVLILSDNITDVKFVELGLKAADKNSSLNITVKNLNQISSFNLNLYQSVLVIASGNIPNPERLKAFMNNGGGLLLFPGSGSTLASFQINCQSLGLPQPVQLLGEINQVSEGTAFQNIEFTHPLFFDLFIRDDKKRIESPDIYAHYNVNPSGKGESIITLNDGSSFLSEYKMGRGKALLFNIAPVLEWSNFPVKSIFVPLLHKSVYYLASADRNQNSFTAGESAVIKAVFAAAGQIKIERPDKSDEFIQLNSNAGSEYISYSKTNLAGNYNLLSGEKMIDKFSVNPSPTESKTEYLVKEDLEEYLKKIAFKGKFFFVEHGEDPSKVIMQSRFGSELWRFFIIAALILAVLEMIISRNTRKEIATI